MHGHVFCAEATLYAHFTNTYGQAILLRACCRTLVLGRSRESASQKSEASARRELCGTTALLIVPRNCLVSFIQMTHRKMWSTTRVVVDNARWHRQGIARKHRRALLRLNCVEQRQYGSLNKLSRFRYELVCMLWRRGQPCSVTTAVGNAECPILTVGRLAQFNTLSTRTHICNGSLCNIPIPV